jgi:hypothetical protein
MSGKNFRVVLGTAEAVRYTLCDSEAMNACGPSRMHLCICNRFGAV